MQSNFRAFGLSSAFAPLVLAALIGSIDLYGSSTLAQSENKVAEGAAAKAPGASAKKEGADPDESKSGSTSSSSTDLNKLNGQPTEQPAASIANTTTTNLSQALDQVPTKRLRFTLFTRQEFGRADIYNDTTGSRLGATFIQAAYSLTPTKIIQFRQEAWYTKANAMAEGTYNLRDPFIAFNNMALAKFWDNASLISMTRLYLPTGEESRFITKQQGGLLQWFIVNKPVGKFEFDYHLIGLYFNQSQNTYIGPRGTPVANLDYDIETWLSAKYNITPWLNVFQTGGLDSAWRRPIDGAGIQRLQYAEMETGVSIQPNSNLTVIASLYNYANIFDSKNPYSPYRDDETIYRLIVSATM